MINPFQNSSAETAAWQEKKNRLLEESACLLELSKRLSSVVDIASTASTSFKKDAGALLRVLPEADYSLAVVQHMLGELIKRKEKEQDAKDDPGAVVSEHVFAHMQISDLRRTALTALISPITPTELPQWILDIDKVASDMFRWQRLVAEAANQLAEVRARPSKRELKAMFEKTQAELESKFGSKYAAQLALSKAQLFGTTEMDTSNGKVTINPINSVSSGVEIEGKPDKARRPRTETDEMLTSLVAIGESVRFPSSEATTEEAAEIITQPILLAKFSFDNKSEGQMLSAGLKVVTVFGHYKQIHNAKILAVPSLLIPANPIHARRMATAHLIEMREASKDYSGLRLASAPYRIRKSKTPGVSDMHVCYILLPDSVTGVNIEAWDFSTNSGAK